MYSGAMDTTLDAWEILQTVVQLGGFAPAAEKLNRSQSTISYAIGRLQEQLGVRLFEIQGRKAQLTELGRVLLADAEPHLAGFHQLEQRARLMASGGASEVRLSVDSIFPDDRLFAALASFSSSFPHVKPKLRQGTFLSADSEFSLHNAQLCVTGLMSRELFVKPILVIEMIAVVRRDHPLLVDPAQALALGPDAAHAGDHRKRGIREPEAPAAASRTARAAGGHDRIGDRGRSQRALFRLAAEVPHSVANSTGAISWPSTPCRQDPRCPAESGLQRLEPSNSEANALAELLGMNREPEMI